MSMTLVKLIAHGIVVVSTNYLIRSQEYQVKIMFKRKSVHSLTEHNELEYCGVDLQERSDVNHDGINRDDENTLSFWKVALSKWYRHRGLVWAVASVFAATSFSLCIKSVAGKVRVSQGMFFRGFAQVLFSLPSLTYHKVSLNLPRKTLMLILARSLVGTLSVFCYYFALQALPVATVKALLYTSPLFTGIFARMCLGERCSVRIVFFACLTLIAVALVVQPPFLFGGSDVETRNTSGVLAAIVTAIGLGLTTIIIRCMQILRVDAYVIIFLYGLFLMFSFGVMAVSLGEWNNLQCGADRGFVIGLATSACMEQITLTLALQTQPALIVSIIRTNDVFVSFIIDSLIFDIVPNAWTIVGAILVVGSAMGMTLSSNREKRRLLADGDHSDDGVQDPEVS